MNIVSIDQGPYIFFSDIVQRDEKLGALFVDCMVRSHLDAADDLMIHQSI